MNKQSRTRFGVIVLSRETINHIVNFLISLFLLVFLYDHSLLKSFDDNIYKYVMLIVSIILIVLGRAEKKRNAGIFIALVLSILISILVKNEETLIPQLCAAVAIMFFFFFDEKFFDDFTVAAVIGYIPFFYIFLVNIFVRHYPPNNHSALHVAVCGFLIVDFLQRRNVHFKIIFVIEIVLIALGVSFGSRTALIATVVGFALIVLDELRTNNKRSTALWATVGFLALVVGIIVFYDKIYSVLFLKWGHHSYEGHGSIILNTINESSRMAMWKVVFDNISLFGYPSYYVLRTFGYDNIHNGYIQAYVQYGIFTFVLYLVFLIKSARTCIKNRIDRSHDYFVLLIELLTISLFESNFILDPEYQFLGLILLMVCGVSSTFKLYDDDI